MADRGTPGTPAACSGSSLKYVTVLPTVPRVMVAVVSTALASCTGLGFFFAAHGFFFAACVVPVQDRQKVGTCSDGVSRSSMV